MKHSLLILFVVIVAVAFESAAHACPDVDGLADLNCDGRVEIIAFGDSITVGERDSTGLGYPGRLKVSFFPNVLVRNFGLGGEETSRGRSRAARRFSQFHSSDYSIVLEGVNDYFATSHSAGATKGNLQAIVRSAANSGSVPSLCTLTNVRRSQQQPWVHSVNSVIRPLTRIDFFALGQGIISSDNLHPNGSGYQRMATVASQVLLTVSEASRPADSDRDGLYDFEEVRYGTNVNIADTDGDGLSDGVEVFTYHSNPLVTDTDGDGVSDFVEATVRHTDPTSPIPLAPTLSALRAVP